MATSSSACPGAPQPLVVRCLSRVYPLRDRLVDPYVQPVLYIRRPGSDLEETHRFPDDDPFFSEISNLIDVVEDIEEEDPESATILSSFEGAYLFCSCKQMAQVWRSDACKTYELTWAIRRASEKSRKNV
jgi:hypothetical protein